LGKGRKKRKERERERKEEREKGQEVRENFMVRSLGFEEVHSCVLGDRTLVPGANVIPARGGYYSEWIMFVLGAAGFLLSSILRR
jgi:hypothetical protein